MMKVILLILMAFPETGGKVILKVGVPDAEFYLDANFVAVTDKSGTLTMENFPAGSFSFSVKKKGYKQYDGSFTIRDGEDKQLSLRLEKTAEIETQPVQISKNSEAMKALREKPRVSVSAAPPVMQPQQAPKQNTSAGIPVTTSAPAPDASAEPEDSSSATIPIILLAVGLCAFGFWIWKMKHARQQIPVADAPREIENEERAGDVSVRPAPEFIEELKRREELMNAGFVGNKPRTADLESSKEKEIVIVLPKEAFHYEEDK
jgi:hypothetical protein